MLKEYLVHTSDRTVSSRTRRAYQSVIDAIAYDGQTIARAYGSGGFLPSTNANPYDTFEDFLAAAKDAREGYGVVWVSDANHNGAFLGSDSANYRFRAHHDAVHALSGLGFDFLDECKVAVKTCETLHLDRDACAVIAGEVIGQGLYFGQVGGQFPLDERGKQPTFHVTESSVNWARKAFKTFANWEL